MFEQLTDETCPDFRIGQKHKRFRFLPDKIAFQPLVQNEYLLPKNGVCVEPER
jgi:hypothetical protein